MPTAARPRKTNRETRLAPEREENNMRRVGGLFLFAILAGFCIGLGGTVFLRLRDAFPGGTFIIASVMTLSLNPVLVVVFFTSIIRFD